jgi:hypothetical protein
LQKCLYRAWVIAIIVEDVGGKKLVGISIESWKDRDDGFEVVDHIRKKN